MSDKRLPDYKNEPSEFGSVRKVGYPRAIQLQVNLITRKVMQVRNLVALKQLTDDVQHSIISSNPTAKAEMRQLINSKARELKFKPVHGELFWH